MKDNYIQIDDIVSFKKIIGSFERIIIYGAGRMSEYLYQYMKYCKLEDKIKCYCVSGDVSDSIYHHGIRVISFADVKNDGVPIVLGMGEITQQEVKKMLSEKQIVSYALSDNIFLKMKYYSEYNESNKLEKTVLGALKEKAIMRQEGILFISPPYWDVYAPLLASGENRHRVSGEKRQF